MAAGPASSAEVFERSSPSHLPVVDMLSQACVVARRCGLCIERIAMGIRVMLERIKMAWSQRVPLPWLTIARARVASRAARSRVYELVWERAAPWPELDRSFRPSHDKPRAMPCCRDFDAQGSEQPLLWVNCSARRLGGNERKVCRGPVRLHVQSPPRLPAQRQREAQARAT